MVDIARGLVFVGFVVLGAAVSLARDEAWRRRSISFLSVYAIGVNLMIAVTQHDAWPFSPFILYGSVPSTHARLHLVEARLVDDRGIERAMHPLTPAPMPMIVFEGWLERGFPRLVPAEQRRAAEFLLDLAERDRERVCSGKQRRGQSFLGQLAAPQGITSELFERPPDDCAHALREVRVYEWSWIPAERFYDRQRVTRTLLYELRR